MLMTQAAKSDDHAQDAAAESPSSAAKPTLTAQSSAPTGVANRAYPAPAQVPTQEGSNGVRFDFNEGCRLTLPESDRPLRVVLRDLDTHAAQQPNAATLRAAPGASLIRENSAGAESGAFLRRCGPQSEMASTGASRC